MRDRAFHMLRLGLIMLCALGMLSGCMLGRRVPKKQDTPQFVSPLPPADNSGLTLAQVRERIESRQRSVRTLKASGQIIVGGTKGFPRQQFDVTMYFQPPSFMRIRGSQDTGTVFDLLWQKQDVKMLVFPERKFYRGTLNDLRRSPMILMGIAPEDLISDMTIDQTLLQKLKSNVTNAGFEETADHYMLTLAYANNMSERFSLRKADLLVDAVDRYYNGQVTSNVSFWTYQLAGDGVVPSRFQVKMASGGEFSADMQQLTLDEPLSPEMRNMSVPEGFERMAIGI